MQVPGQLSPEQLQLMIDAAVQKSLAARSCRSSRAGSVRSASSVSTERKAPEGVHARSPDSPTCSHASQPSGFADAQCSD